MLIVFLETGILHMGLYLDENVTHDVKNAHQTSGGFKDPSRHVAHAPLSKENELEHTPGHQVCTSYVLCPRNYERRLHLRTRTFLGILRVRIKYFLHVHALRSRVPFSMGD